MTKLQIEIGEETDYPGSKIFATLADSVGLSVDLVNKTWLIYSWNFPK